MSHAPVVDVLKGQYEIGTTVTVKGWLELAVTQKLDFHSLRYTM